MCHCLGSLSWSSLEAASKESRGGKRRGGKKQERRRGGGMTHKRGEEHRKQSSFLSGENKEPGRLGRRAESDADAQREVPCKWICFRMCWNTEECAVEIGYLTQAVHLCIRHARSTERLFKKCYVNLSSLEWTENSQARNGNQWLCHAILANPNSPYGSIWHLRILNSTILWPSQEDTQGTQAGTLLKMKVTYKGEGLLLTEIVNLLQL